MGSGAVDSSQWLSVKEETIFLHDGLIRVTDLAELPSEIGVSEQGDTEQEFGWGKKESLWARHIEMRSRPKSLHLLRALDHFLRGYQWLVQHLEQIQSADAQNARGVQRAKARKYYSTAREAVVIRFCGFLHDTLTHLSNLSDCLQRSAITIAEAHSSLCSTQAVLKKYKNRLWRH